MIILTGFNYNYLTLITSISGKIQKCIPSLHDKGHSKSYDIYTKLNLLVMLIMVSICETTNCVLHIIRVVN